jgi:hypothetical protein
VAPGLLRRGDAPARLNADKADVALRHLESTMQSLTLAACLTALVLAILPALPAAAPPAPQPVSPEAATRYDAARDEYEVGHFDAAFATFAALADEGHCDAVRMALQMVRYGRSLYATEFKVTLERVQHWQRQGHCATLERRVARGR